MQHTVTIQELALVIATENHNPTLLNLDFLKCSGIVEEDWQVSRPPICHGQASQIVFQNGISLASQSDRIIFLEAIAAKPDTEIQVAAIAHRYINVLQKGNYRAVGINFRGYVNCDQAEVARQYMTQTLLAPGSWQDFGEEPVQAAVNFSYTLEDGQFVLSVNDAAIQKTDESPTPVVLFSGNFSYDLKEESDPDRLKQLAGIIDNWQSNLDIYRDLINTKFLADVAPSTPLVADLLTVNSRS
jgi:hypothetical protein